jgi:hypothetical protein
MQKREIEQHTCPEIRTHKPREEIHATARQSYVHKHKQARYDVFVPILAKRQQKDYACRIGWPQPPEPPQRELLERKRPPDKPVVQQVSAYYKEKIYYYIGRAQVSGFPPPVEYPVPKYYKYCEQDPEEFYRPYCPPLMFIL